jgi:hypothetical protein
MGSALVAAVLVGCSNPAGLDGEDVAGSWSWTGSEGGIAGSVLTPASEGYSVRIVLDGDGTAQGFRNDSLIATTQYAVLPRLSLVAPGHDPEYEIHFDPPLAVLVFASIEGGVVRLSRDGPLRIEEPCCDRYTHKFERGLEP